ncbi:serine/threonine-protein phosphatase 2A 56 kDa regulatory subunit gamma isoform-like [Thalassophryne amazonica]|uniref:serine/threonine-protein phosphatase 2A 56 kDa regulatory subunit gamma isoform-like n=2 Tax=Thalassophryne amazonica TaxID=390379 RepID=UPI001471806F|nr:serine/threonine-protein phosphatase 2A 56 kDa regulatory subunit gamma isoform-like [Thalassophryne amazonica]
MGIKNGASYVAVGKGKFKPAAYGQQSQPSVKNSTNERKVNASAVPTMKPPMEVDLQQCSVVCDFHSDTNCDLEKKEQKQMALKRVLYYFKNETNTITEPMYPEMVNMCEAIIFRTLPPLSSLNEADDNEYTLDVPLPLPQLALQCLSKFLTHPTFDPKIGEKYIDKKFVMQLLQLFESTDPMERKILKVVLYGIIETFAGLRKFIFKEISHIFCRFIYETGHHSGIAELLDLIRSLIKDLEEPLRQDDRNFLLKVLMPLHTAESLGDYHPELVRCVARFLEKDEMVTEPVVMALLKYWPKSNIKKELMFLDALEDILPIIDQSVFIKVQTPVFKRLAKCASSLSQKVAERTLLFFDNEDVMILISDNARTIIPILLPVLKNSAQTHWKE